jgi:hypothetical protein
MCDSDLHMHTGRYDHPEVVLTLFRSIGFQSYAVGSQIQAANKRIGNVYPDLTVCSSSNQDCKTISILAAV